MKKTTFGMELKDQNKKEKKYSNPMWNKEEQEAVDKYVKSIRFKAKDKEETKNE